MERSAPARPRCGGGRAWNDVHMRSAGTCLLLVLFVVSGCGEPPRRAPFGTAPAADANAGPQPTAARSDAEPIRISGVVELHGALARPPVDAALFVSVKPRQGEFASVPSLTRRIDLAGLASGAAGVLRVPFELTGADTMAGAPPLSASKLPPTFDVEALYDPTGGLRDKERLVRQRVPVDGVSAAGVTVVLRAD